MSKDQAIGALILAVSVVGIVAYAWLVFFTDLWAMVLRLTGFVAVGGILVILAWIGYTLATTPPPKPIEAIESEVSEASKAEESPVKESEASKASEAKAEAKAEASEAKPKEEAKESSKP